MTKSTFTFTESERAFHTEMRGITTDAHGQEILVGLTLEETQWYMEYARGMFVRRARDGHDPEASKKYLALHDKHQRARFQVLGAEIEARNERPTRH